MKLYPPQIAGTLPAFYADYLGAITIQVPFSMNAAVHKTEVAGIKAIIKTVQNNAVISEPTASRIDFDNNIAYFDIITADNIDEYYDYQRVDLKDGENWIAGTYYVQIDEDKYKLDEDIEYKATQIYYLRKNKYFSMGQFYKIQLAYIDAETGTVGYYSTVGVIKFTSLPQVTIPMLSRRKINLNQASFVGLYSQGSFTYKPVEVNEDNYVKNTYYYYVANRQYILDASVTYTAGRQYYVRHLIMMPDNSLYMDATEKVHDYRFVIYDSTGAIVADSGEQIHNIENNTASYESIDNWTFNINLDEHSLYKIQYIITTNNLLTVASPSYTLIQRQTIAPDYDLPLHAENNEEEGCITITFNATSEISKSQFIQGAFLLTRSCLEENYATWEEVTRFRLYGIHPDKWQWQDFTVEQGKTYKYALQQFNDRDLYSRQEASNAVMADFEHAFLYDGEKQLKIKYNPKVASFKTDILEQKVDTIGSKHPFIFRNGVVNYKEFSLSGLLSYMSDEANLFIDDDQLGLTTKSLCKISRSATIEPEYWTYKDGKLIKRTPEEIKKHYNDPDVSEELDNREVIAAGRPRATNDLGGYNVAAERRFKLSVLDWLNNGQVKLFRSPSEGNYLVRLTNISLAPEDQLGRMIHTFTSTAYEIADCTHDNLIKYGILKTTLPEFMQFRWKTVPLVERVLAAKEFVEADDKSYTYFKEKYNREVQYKSNTQDPNSWVELLGTGEAAYEIRFEDIMPGAIVRLRNQSQKDYTTVAIGATGVFNYASPNDLIVSVQIPGDAKYIGQLTYRYRAGIDNSFQSVANVEIESIPLRQFVGANDNILDQLIDIKHSISAVRFVRFRRTEPRQLNYGILANTEGSIIDSINDPEAFDCWFTLNGKESRFNIKDIEGYVQQAEGNYTKIGCGAGVTIEICCEILKKTYEVEISDEALIKVYKEQKIDELEDTLDMDSILEKSLRVNGGLVSDTNVHKQLAKEIHNARPQYRDALATYYRAIERDLKDRGLLNEKESST